MPTIDKCSTSKPVFLRLPYDLHALLSRAAKKKKVTIQKIIIATLDEELRKDK